MGRKANGRSSIFLGSDGYWHGWVTVGVKADGKPDRRHRRGRTQTEVTKKVEALEKLRNESRVDVAGKKPKFAEWLRIWLDDIAPQTASKSTVEEIYRPRLEYWVIPRVGHHRLNQLKASHLDALYSELRKTEKLAPKSIAMLHQMISRSLKMARKRNLVSDNVATLVEAPTFRDPEIEPLSQDEARAILRAVGDTRNGARWSVALALGLRQCEALGMRWRYLDLESKQLRVWQLKRSRFSHGCDDHVACTADRHNGKCRENCVNHGRYCPQRLGGEWKFVPPKGGKTRFVPIPDEVIPQLRAQKSRQAAERLSAGDAWEDWDLVFGDRKGRPINPRRDWAEWKGLLTLAGIRDARPHDARHTAATLLLEQGVDIRVVQEILGHSSLAVTKRYTHVTSKLARDAASKIGGALWG